MSQNISFMNVTYSSIDAITLPKAAGGSARFDDTTDATASAADIALDKTAYVNGVKVIGTSTGGSSENAISITDASDSGGGVIRTITAINISDTTATASDVASGKYFYTADGTKTAGTASGGGGDSSLPERTSADLVVSGATVTVPSGAYAAEASATVGNGSAATPATTITANPSISVNSSTGLIIATASTTQNVTPTVSAGYVSSGTAGTITVNGSNTSQLTVQAAQTIHPSTSDQTISSGKYLTGTQTIKGVTISNLTAGNIKKGTVVEVGDSSDSDCITSITGTFAGWTKIGDTTELTVSTTSTSASSAGTITIDSSIYTKNKIIYVRIRDKEGKRNGYFYGSDTYFMNYWDANGATSTLSVCAQCHYRYNNNALASTAGAYGVYGYSITSAGVLTIRRRYNSTNTLTINSTYLIDVYTIDPPQALF